MTLSNLPPGTSDLDIEDAQDSPAYTVYRLSRPGVVLATDDAREVADLLRKDRGGVDLYTVVEHDSGWNGRTWLRAWEEASEWSVTPG